jgi:hypothetical protein
MASLADFIPFYPRPERLPPELPRTLDVDRALDVEMHAHPSLEQRRAANGELVLRVRRQRHLAERFLARFVTVEPYRHAALDQYGEFLLTEGTRPGVLLAQVAEGMAQRFGLAPEDARLGTLRLVRELMLREFVFLVRQSATDGNHAHEPRPGPEP